MRTLFGVLIASCLTASPAIAQTSSVFRLLPRGDEEDERATTQAAGQDRVRYAARYAGTSANLRYYGSQGSAPLDANSFDYRFESVGTIQRLQFTHGDAPLFGGMHYLLAATRSHFTSNLIPIDVSRRAQQSNLGGVGASLEYHPHNNPTARRSTDFIGNFTWYDRILGSTSNFGKLELGGLFYMQPSRRWGIGARIDARSAWGEVPFFETPYLAMRGLPPRQFTNDVVVLTELEAQRAVARRWTVLAFGGIGHAAQSWTDIPSTAARTAGGVGFRYLLVRETGMRSGIDVARTPDGFSLYVQSGAVWP